MGPSITRRQLLQTGLTSLSVGIAGCAGRVLDDAGEEVARNSVFEETSFDGADLVVQLRENADISTVNLVGPDGQLFTSASVAAGVTRVRLRLFDMLSGRRYSPGEHTLVGVQGGEEVASATLDLRPELEIVAVEPYTGGRDVPLNRGNLVVTVENVGTGPTWVYYVGYEGAPWESANEFPSERLIRYQPEVYLQLPETTAGRIISPAESQQLLGRHSPLLLPRGIPCDGQTLEIIAIVKTGVGSDARGGIQATLSGGLFQTRSKRTCHDLVIELVESE